VSIGSNVKRCRRKRKFTQKELADKTGMSIQTLSRIENDVVDPRAATLKKIIDVLNVSANQIFKKEKGE
jgi:transcriptional regulator with XRE-family HTH domain